MPKGGGALKGIDEKFEVNSANGTASFSIPLPITPSRGNFSPQLALSYNSGSGNSPFGLGWSVGYSSIQLQTNKCIPKYNDEDIYTISGAEDLLPCLEKKDNQWKITKTVEANYSVIKYRPRIEGGFARIEKIIHKTNGVYWRVTTRDNVTTFYGTEEDYRISDPQNPNKIYQWLPVFSFDDKGNCIYYEYKAENIDNVPDSKFEKNRKAGLAPFTNKYLKRIKYGNLKPYYFEGSNPYGVDIPDKNYLFELVFDYGEHTSESEPLVETNKWSYRPDAFSSYRSGFEIRTNRLCKRILMFHHFEGENQFQNSEPFGKDYLVRSLELEHKASSINDLGQTEVSYLAKITQRGYIRKGNTYFDAALPPMEFQYQNLNWNTAIKTIDSESIVNAPVGLTNNYQWTDLYGEGISGILTEQAFGWFYKENLGTIPKKDKVTFTRAKAVASRPSINGLNNGTLSLQDLDANGQKQFVVNTQDLKGYFELTENENWATFRSFSKNVTINLQDPNTRQLDITGDGKPDLVITEDHAFSWYESLGKEGYSRGKHKTVAVDEEYGPKIVFADQQQSIFLADFSGDGLTDIVRIRNGEVCYWANMGYGKFSAKISMENAPYFDYPEMFNPKYIHLADVSGTGATDIIYLGNSVFKAYINLSGNAFSNAHEIEPFFPTDSNSKLSVIDLLGTGTSCIVWSSDLPAHANAPMRYMDLMDSKKPHVLKSYCNNLGKETSFEYKSSTYYYLKDKLSGTPWKTRLPFPVQVVSQTIVQEHITNVRFASSYDYHHGYYDHTEKEFRGFGRVDQLDSEFYPTWKKNAQETTLELNEDLYQAPVLTKSWFHTGAHLSDADLLNQFEDEYWYHHTEVTNMSLIPEMAYQLPSGKIIHQDRMSPQEFREAHRACKGMLLRQEVFSFEGEDASIHKIPYTVATHNCHVQCLQPKQDNPYAVFINTESEAITFHYERHIHDPRIAHSLNIKIDDLGNVLENAAVVYPRLQFTDLETLKSEVQGLNYQRQEEQKATLDHISKLEDAQKRTHIIYTVNSFTNDIQTKKDYRLRLPASAKTYELKNVDKPLDHNIYDLDSFSEIIENPALEVPYHLENTKGYRLIEHIESHYYDRDLNTSLPLGEMAAHGLPYESYQLAFNNDLIENVFGTKIQDSKALFIDEGKYVNLYPNDYWIPSGFPIYKKASQNIDAVKKQFFTPIAYQDPFVAKTTLEFYKEYYLFPKTITDALGNTTAVLQFNFRTLSPIHSKDLNYNETKILLDELGLVKAVAVLGKGDEADNLDTLTEYTAPSESDAIKNYFAIAESSILQEKAYQFLQGATARFVYDFNSYWHSKSIRIEELKKGAKDCAIPKYIPTTVGSIVRERHVKDVKSDPTIAKSPLQLSFEYTDGLGNVAMKKVQAEPGEALQLQLKPNCEFTLDTMHTDDELRWIGNGRTVLNNKGNPVKQYEPYFSSTPFYEDHKVLIEQGLTPIIYYDALSRVIKTQFPDGTLTKVEFNAWEQKHYDQNDCVAESNWFKNREALPINAKERQAAKDALRHNDTPTCMYTDTLGRPILQLQHHIQEDWEDGNIKSSQTEYYTTFIDLDIEGNVQQLLDARGNRVMQYRYNLLGHRIYENSMDAGERWMLTNVGGNSMRNWDTKDQLFKTQYDALQRPLEQWLHSAQEKYLIERFEYGEMLPDIEAKHKNLKGQLHKHYDSSGFQTQVQIDFKGNALEVTRQFPEFQASEILDWSQNIVLRDNIVFTLNTQYDALNRMVKLYNWHRNKDYVAVYIPTYNERGVLRSEVQITGMNVNRLISATNGKHTNAILNIAYNEKGQRTLLKLGNHTTTTYKYDPKTYRLLQIRTTRKNEANKPIANGFKEYPLLQNIKYTYDAVGNITHLQDFAHTQQFSANAGIKPICKYTYDALNRLVRATGRENKTFNTAPTCKEPAPIDLYNHSSGEGFRNYRQKYSYDAAGNILQMKHLAKQERWTRDYTYEKDNNRLKTTAANGETVTYSYDAHGSMLNYNNALDKYQPQWDYRNHMYQLFLGGGGKAYYEYDSQLERSYKRIEKPQNIIEERFYLGGMELYRCTKNGVLDEEIETHHLMLDDQRVLLIDDVLTTNNQQLTARALSGAEGNTLYKYQYSNHLGSVGLELDHKAAILSYEEYHPYGSLAYHAKDTAIKATAKRYRYTGMERDTESGLNYHSARYYLPWLGRWLSTDPIGVEGGDNLFFYTDNNPIILLDQNGLNPDSVADGDSSNDESHLVTDYFGSYLPDYLKIVERGGMSIGIAPILFGGSAGVNTGIGERIIINPFSEKAGEVTLTKETLEHAELQLEAEVDLGVELSYNIGVDYHIGTSVAQRGLEGHVSNIGDSKIDGNTIGGTLGINLSAIVGFGLNASFSVNPDGLIDFGIGGEFTVSDTFGASLSIGGESSQSEIKGKENILSIEERKEHKKTLKKIRKKTKRIIDSTKIILKGASKKLLKKATEQKDKILKKLNRHKKIVVKKAHELLNETTKGFKSIAKSIFSLF